MARSPHITHSRCSASAACVAIKQAACSGLGCVDGCTCSAIRHGYRCWCCCRTCGHCRFARCSNCEFNGNGGDCRCRHIIMFDNRPNSHTLNLTISTSQQPHLPSLSVSPPTANCCRRPTSSTRPHGRSLQSGAIEKTERCREGEGEGHRCQ